MNWEAIGAVGDAVGGIGVVCSLIYLAVQTRSNTRALQSASFHQTNEAYANISMSVALDPSLVSVMDRALADSGDLSDDEASRFGWACLSIFRRAESMYFQTQLGALQKESWIGFESTLRLCLNSRVGREWWTATKQRFSPDFRAYIDSLQVTHPPTAA